MRLGLAVASVIVIADQIIKWWAIGLLAEQPYGIEVLPFFNLVLVWNQGISFGIFGGGLLPPWLLGGVALAVALALVIWLRKAETRLLAATIGLVIGGALGNVVDRFRFGAVADFLDFHWAGYHWPAFNLADAAISVGVVILLLDALLIGDERHK
ncbi:MAG: signal peptidase II [Proteobacteria bacterium]|nr:signal peptidase II [Pseudomonadota bacterium]